MYFLRTAAVMAFLLASPVMAAEVPKVLQPDCGLDFRKAVDLMKNKYGEILVGQGFNKNFVTGIYINKETGTFTVLITSLAGESCAVGAGGNWEFFFPKVGDPT